MSVVEKTARTMTDATAIKRQLLESFPFLGQHASVLEPLAKWKSFTIGLADDDFDSEIDEAFSLYPIEELFWRTDWRQDVWFAVACFHVPNAETEICISVNGTGDIYLRREGQPPIKCDAQFAEILDSAAEHADSLATYLATLSRTKP